MKSCVYFVLLWSTVSGYTADDLKNLKKYIFSDYDKSIRPIYNQSRPIQIGISFTLRSIVNFDTSNGQLDTIGILSTLWRDENLPWNGSQYEDISRVVLPSDIVWTPQVVQMNAMAPEEIPLTSTAAFKDGTVFHGIARTYTTFCKLNMRYYPADEHECTFEFISGSYPIEYLELYSLTNNVDISDLAEHGEWKVTSTSSEKLEIGIRAVDIQGDGITYTLVLGRQATFNLIHRLVPLILLAVCTLCVHVVPLNSGERVSYAVTVLLAFVFWQAIVAEELPKNSAKISLFSMIITLFLCVSGCFTIVSTCLCRVESIDPEQDIPIWIQKLTKMFRKRNKNKQYMERQVSETCSIDKQEEQNHNNCMKETGYVNGQNHVFKNIDTENGSPVTWVEAAKVFDRLFFIIHALAVLIFTVAFIVIAAMRISF